MSKWARGRAPRQPRGDPVFQLGNAKQGLRLGRDVHRRRRLQRQRLKDRSSRTISVLGDTSRARERRPVVLDHRHAASAPITGLQVHQAAAACSASNGRRPDPVWSSTWLQSAPRVRREPHPSGRRGRLALGRRQGRPCQRAPSTSTGGSSGHVARSAERLCYGAVQFTRAPARRGPPRRDHLQRAHLGPPAREGRRPLPDGGGAHRGGRHRAHHARGRHARAGPALGFASVADLLQTAQHGAVSWSIWSSSTTSGPRPRARPLSFRV